MKLSKFAILALGIGLAGHALANEEPKSNLINLQAEASRQVSNDKMQSVLFIEKSNKQPAALANQVAQSLNQAIALSKKYPQVKVETGSQSTYPVYDNDNKKLKEWRARAEINLESKDFNAASQLISELQQNFQTESIQFAVSSEKRNQVENELITEATKNFQQRAQILSQAWSKTGYNLINLNVNTNNVYHQPAMMRSAVTPKLVSYNMVESQNISAGESTISVNANGSIQLK
jgi:predicted secreted protein